MQFTPDIELQQKLIRQSKYLLYVIGFISLTAFAGWMFSIEQLKYPVAGLVAMNPLTSLCFLTLIIALNWKKTSRSKSLLFVGTILTLLVLIVAGWKLLSVIFDLPFSLDRLFFKNAVDSDIVAGFPNTMAPNTALCFCMSALAVLFMKSKGRLLLLISQAAVMGSLMMAVFSLLGYVFGAKEFYEVQNFIPMALNSAICFFLLSLSVMFTLPERGFMQQLTSNYSGSYMAWRLFVPAFLLPVIIGLFRVWGQRSGLYNLEFGSALFVTSMILVFLSLIWLNTLLLNRRENKQEEIIKEKNYLANLVQQTSDAILSTDPNLVIKSWNKGAVDIYGYSPEEVIGKPLGSFLQSTLDPETTQRLMGDLIKKGYYNAEYIFFDKQKKPVHVQASVTVLKNEQQEITGYVALHRDISERKQLEMQLREFNHHLGEQVQEKTAELRDVFERISDAFIGIDNDYNIVYANNKAEALFDLDLRQIANTSIFSLFSNNDGETEQALHEAFETREYIYLETWLQQFGKWFELNIYPSSSGLSVYFRDITRRKMALQELNASEEKYRLFFENSMDGILLTDGKGKIFSANQAACDIFGMSEEEICSTGREGILDESDPNWPIFFEARNRNGKAQGELRHFRKDGSVFMAEITSVKFKTASGDEQTNTIIRDITSRKKAEEALYKSEEKYRNLVEQAGDGIAIFAPNGKILDVNESASSFLGYSKSELAKFTISDILDKEELNISPIRFDLLLQGESTIRQRKMKHKNGSYVETEVRAKRLPDGNFLAIIRDLTDRMKAQQQLQKEKDLSDSIINSMPGIFYFYDINGKFLRWNKQFEDVSEYSGEEISAMHPLDFFTGDDRAYLQVRIGEVFTNGVSDAEASFVTKSGRQIPYFFTGARIEVNGVPCLLGMGVDITDRKRTEAEIQESYQQIRRLTAHLQNIREEERAHIAREIHDELGQQLTVMKMDLAWMKKKIKNGDAAAVPPKMDELQEILDGTVASVRRIATELRPSLLDDIGLIAAIEWQIEVFSKRTGIHVHLSKPEIPIHVPDELTTGLFRILQESLTNIARHANATDVDIHLKNQNNEFILYIEDDGEGFDMNTVAGKKTLGLLGMKERSVMMSGVFSVTSKPGAGTKVEVRVPLS